MDCALRGKTVTAEQLLVKGVYHSATRSWDASDKSRADGGCGEPQKRMGPVRTLPVVDQRVSIVDAHDAAGHLPRLGPRRPTNGKGQQCEGR